MVGSSLAPKLSKLVPFCGINHQKSIFQWYLIPLLSEAVEASWYSFFKDRLKKLKCPHLLNKLGTLIQENYWSFYPSEPFTLARFNMRHPVCTHKLFVYVIDWFYKIKRQRIWKCIYQMNVDCWTISFPSFLWLIA